MLSGEASPSWNVRTDGTTMIASAPEFASLMKARAGDFNEDAVADDDDFIAFHSGTSPLRDLGAT